MSTPFKQTYRCIQCMLKAHLNFTNALDHVANASRKITPAADRNHVTKTLQNILGNRLPTATILRRPLSTCSYGGVSSHIIASHQPTTSHVLLANSNSARTALQAFAISRRGVSSYMDKEKVFTKDRLILMSVGIIVIGGMAAYNKNFNKSRRNSAAVRKIHGLCQRAQAALDAGEYDEALQHYAAAATTLKQVEVSEMVQATVMHRIVDQLGHIAYNLETWEEAYGYIKESQHLMEKLQTPENDHTYLETLMMRAKLDGMFGHQEDALKSFQQCIVTLEDDISIADLQAPGRSERLTLYGKALHEYGTYTKEKGLLSESMASYSKALNVAKIVLGPRHEQTSVIANDLATVYDEDGRYNKAEKLATKAIRIATETSPDNLATYKYNLGSILLHKGEINRARKELNDAMVLAAGDDEMKSIIEGSVMRLDINIDA